ncbi:MAG: hypothetical protein ABL998_14035 [Planctomycetota bacterium]
MASSAIRAPDDPHRRADSVCSNWIAGPAMLAAFRLMFALGLGPEERLLAERPSAECAS